MTSRERVLTAVAVRLKPVRGRIGHNASAGQSPAATRGRPRLFWSLPLDYWPVPTHYLTANSLRFLLELIIWNTDIGFGLLVLSPTLLLQHMYTDAKATESAWVVNALAYTVGHDVVFGAG